MSMATDYLDNLGGVIHSGPTKYSVGQSRHKVVKIEKMWKVLEIGGGANPCIRANVITNYKSSDNQQGVSPINVPQSIMLECNAESMPMFKNKEFDYCICCHVLEHVGNPTLVCSEITRVSKRGYIETPSQIAEILLGHDFHNWIVSSNGNKLIFRKKLPVEIDRYGNFFKDMFYKDNVYRNTFIAKWFEYWQHGYVCFEWQDNFEVEVIV